MSLTCQELARMATNLALVEDCDVVRNGMLRMSTPFRYPNGGQIDLFLDVKDDQVRLTDLGQTTAYLLDLQIEPWTTQRRKQVVANICRSLDVDREGGELIVRLTPLDLAQNLASAMVRLAQACIRMSDFLSLTSRVRTPTVFRDELEDFVSIDGITVEQDVVVLGRNNREVTVDLRTQGRNVESLVLTLSSRDKTAAHAVANEAFRKWYDLEPVRRKHQFLTVYDSNSDAFRSEDLQRLADMSTVLGYPAQQQEVREAIAA